MAALDEQTERPVVEVSFDHRGRDILASITRQNVGHRIALVIGDEVITAPVIQEPILDGEIEISGAFSQEAAENLALLLRGSSTPAPFRTVSIRVEALPN
jgi:preprotein translocase subunit SecD